MACVPPQKRNSTNTEGRSLTPESLVSKFKNLNLKPFNANNAVRRWILVGLNEDGQVPSSIRLQPFPVEAIKRKMGMETLELVNHALGHEQSEACGQHWRSIAEDVLQDLLASFQAVRNEMKGRTSDDVKPGLVLRPGRVLFGESYFKKIEAAEYSTTEASLRNMRRIFYTNVSAFYVENIKKNVIPKIGLEFHKEKDIFHVKLSDSSRPSSIISCKCSVAEGASGLEPYKIESDALRHMIIDISCLDKKLDLRLMFRSKSKVTTVTKEEWKGITDLVRSAVLDGSVKGGLLWPRGKDSFDGRFRVVGVWHALSESYESSSLRLKFRHADRYDFRTSTEEVAWEVTVSLKRMTSILLEQRLDIDSISNMLKGEMKLIWEHLLLN